MYDDASSPDELAAMLTQVDEVRRHTRAAAHPSWFPLLLFGILGLAAAPFGMIGDGLGIGLFWLVAGPAGGYLTARYYRNRVVARGVGVGGAAYRWLGAALFVTAWVGGWVTRSAVAPMLAIAVAYFGFARLERSWPVAGVASVLAVATIIVALTDPPRIDIILTLVFGVSFTLTGLVLRRDDRG